MPIKNFQNDGLQATPQQHGLHFPEPHNDEVQGASTREQLKSSHWPLLIVLLGVILSLAWASFLGWLLWELVYQSF
jgi:hypothetical protein